MNENLSTTGIILEVLGDLELPLLHPIREKEDGFVVMVSLPARCSVNKNSLKDALEKSSLVVTKIDMFSEEYGRYAWVFIKDSQNTEGADYGRN